MSDCLAGAALRLKFDSFQEGSDTVGCIWVGKGGVGEGWLVGGDQKGGRLVAFAVGDELG